MSNTKRAGKGTKQAGRKRAPLKLSQQANVSELLDLLGKDGSGYLFDLADSIVGNTVSPSTAETVRPHIAGALRAVERGQAGGEARRDYDTLAAILARVRAGESLEEIGRELYPGNYEQAEATGEGDGEPAGEGEAERLARDYPPVEFGEIDGLVDAIIEQDDDEAAVAFVRLMNGINHSHYAEQRGVKAVTLEGITGQAVARAYSKTLDFNDALERFERDAAGKGGAV